MLIISQIRLLIRYSVVLDSIQNLFKYLFKYTCVMYLSLHSKEKSAAEMRIYINNSVPDFILPYII